MNIKVKFAFWFTVFVSFVLIISSFIIYVLYSNFREKEFNARLSKEAIYSHDLFIDKKLKNVEVQDLEKDNEFALINLALFVFNEKQQQVYQYPNEKNLNVASENFIKAKKLNELKLKEGEKEAQLIYFKETGYFVYVSAWDKYGVRKLNNIKLILFGVLIGGILLSAIVSFLFVQQAFKPLKQLSNQMLQTTDIAKTKPIIATNTNDEISLIAKSYNAMIEQLKASFNHQKSFVSHASHELRTPLANMLSQTEAALNHTLSNEELRNTLWSLKEDQQGMIELTNSLLLLSQYENNLTANVTDAVRIDDAITNCMEDLNKAYKDAIFIFNFKNVPNEEDLYFEANRTLLNAAFKNLLKNGYQYSSDKTVKIELQAHKNEINITFENNGEIFDDNEKEKLFIPFFRGVNKQKQKGHGLGLSIVQRIVQVSGGSIAYQTKGNKVNCFHIRLQKQQKN